MQSEHKVFPWLQTFTVLQENYVEYQHIFFNIIWVSF